MASISALNLFIRASLTVTALIVMIATVYFNHDFTVYSSVLHILTVAV